MQSFADFWPYYLARHRRRLTRWTHLAGVAAAAGVSAYGATQRRPRLALPALATLAYATRFGHPVWTLRAEARMLATMLRGRDAQLSRLGRKWLMAHPEHARRAA